MIEQIIVTKSKFWFERYCNERGLDRQKTIWAYSSYATHGHAKTTPVIFVNGFTRIGVHELNQIREHFTNIVTDQL